MVKAFAENFHVYAKRDACGEIIVSGRVGHIYDQHNRRQLGVLLMFQSKMQWTYAKRKLLAAGFTIRQDGDTEGTALFDSTDPALSRLALRIARVKVRRQMSPAQRQATVDRLKHVRESTKAA
jgi:hypothetical protein